MSLVFLGFPDWGAPHSAIRPDSPRRASSWRVLPLS
jgi:hypothetical protein